MCVCVCVCMCVCVCVCVCVRVCVDEEITVSFSVHLIPYISFFVMASLCLQVHNVAQGKGLVDVAVRVLDPPEHPQQPVSCNEILNKSAVSLSVQEIGI
jgi:hypothetical protein